MRAHGVVAPSLGSLAALRKLNLAGMPLGSMDLDQQYMSVCASLGSMPTSPL